MAGAITETALYRLNEYSIMNISKEERQALLAPYEVDCERGFLPSEDPLIPVPATLGGWVEIADRLPKLFVAGQVRRTIDSMPVIETAGLKTKQELERAMVAFSYLGHSYVWSESKPPQALPASLAVPWHAIAKKLGRPPVLSYASYMLHNWQRVDKEQDVRLGNICLIQNFLGGIDEEWFVVTHLDIEKDAGPGLAAILPAQQAVEKKDVEALERELKTIKHSLDLIYKSLLRMPEYCDPYIYFHRVRPYIHGWKDHPLFPAGLTYEGVTEYQGKPQNFRGQTGAQSSVIPSMDAALGIGHKEDVMKHYLLEMRDYMPPAHKAFIEAIEQGPSIREFVAEQAPVNKSLREIYNGCVQRVENFRSQHIQYAKNYIFKQSENSSSNPHAVGTGGTPFIPYLQKHRDETEEHLLDQK
jgi:indoleamine 2,3-dioxygenase